MKVAISQPTYLGWPGYFALINAVDVFVLLDTVSVSKQSWQMRNRIRQPSGRTSWLSIPTHAHKGQPLKDVEIDYSRQWQRKHWATIKACYQGEECWENIAWLENAYHIHHHSLGDLTSSLTATISASIGITTRITRASLMPPTRQGKTDRLEDILTHLDATTYVTTGGASYLDDITHLGPARVDRFTYQPTPYPQGSQPWLSHLSIVDLLAHHPHPYDVINPSYPSGTCSPPAQNADHPVPAQPPTAPRAANP